ncbi:MAG TPA: LytTR family DNA-binding domain-containing protein [Rhizomicrobium sp.]
MLRQTFLYCFGIAAVIVGVINVINFLTMRHEEPGYGVAGPLVWEASSWVSLMAFYWIPWVVWRLAPPTVRPRWKLLAHFPGVAIFVLAHVYGFVQIRTFLYWLGGDHYNYGPFFPHFLYEFSKDGLGYVVIVFGYTLVEHLLRNRAPSTAPGPIQIFDIRDGAKLTRVRLDDVLAVASAGNYVEFVLSDGRRLMMRSPLSALETELSPRGFLRTHRSWLVNPARMTALKPEGSGDYEVELGPLKVPLSRRFPDALARLRGA